MVADSDEAEEKFSLAKEVLEPWVLDAIPAVTSLPPEIKPDTKEGAAVAEYTVPTPERCVTQTGLLSAAASPSRPRTSPKRKQLSSPAGSEVIDGWENAVKRHRGSMPESIPYSRLPGRMPYGTPCLAEEEGPGAAGEGRNESPIQREEGELAAPPMVLKDIGKPPDLQQGEEPKDLLVTAPVDGGKPLGPSGDEPALAEGVMEGWLLKLSEGDESTAA